MTGNPNRRGSSLRLFISIAGSQIAGLAVAIFLVTGPVAGGSEPTITGSVLLAFGLGWGLLAILSTRITDQPQRWALVPAASMGLVGLGLIVAQPSTDVIGILSWIWPLALVALVIFMVISARASLRSRLRRWVLYPVFAILVLVAVGGAAEAIMELGDRAAPMTGQLVDVGDHRLRIDCTGVGSPTVVLESGLGESSFYWARISAAVATTTRVCVYDRAGRGWSESAPKPQDGLAIAADLHTLLSKSGNPGPYVLVGHSSGGVYVRIFAAKYPDEVAGMVLLDAQPPGSLHLAAGLPGLLRQHAHPLRDPATGRAPRSPAAGLRVGLRGSAGTGARRGTGRPGQRPIAGQRSRRDRAAPRLARRRPGP